MVFFFCFTTLQYIHKGVVAIDKLVGAARILQTEYDALEM
jgi:hypothetical protein